MSSTKGLYDDPAFLEMVKAEFAKMWPYFPEAVDDREHVLHWAAYNRWIGFRKGVEFAVTEGLKEGEG